jgi:NADPH2:quinone reductase
MPTGWGFVESAGLFVTAPTSYAALVQRAQVKKGMSVLSIIPKSHLTILSGETVLIHAAAGGVGLAAVQIAKALGATVVATSGSQHKLDMARSFGADHAINYTSPSWPEEVKKLTPDEKGVDVVYDPVGMIENSMKCIAWNGRQLVVGFAAGNIEKVAMNRVLLKNCSIVGIHWGQFAVHEPPTVEAVWEGLFALIADGKFRGTCFTDREYVGLESIPAALKALGARETWGKVAVKVPQEAQSKI